jgi:hypothetical protein
LGISALSNNTLCPAGFYCPTTGLGNAVQCLTSIEKNTTNSSEYCPQGTFTQNLCPEGYQCNTVTTITKCLPGYFCPAGTRNATSCPSKFYCTEDAIKKTICPRGFYCPSGTIKPIACQLFVDCPEGTDEQQLPYIALLIFLVIIIFFYILFQCIKCCIFLRKKQRRKQKMTKRNVEKLQGHQLGIGANIAALAGNKDYKAEVKRSKFNAIKSIFLRTKKKTIGVVPLVEVTPMDIELKDVGFSIKKNNKTIFEGMNIKISGGKTTGIIGLDRKEMTCLIDLLSGIII